jgi:DNA-binding response OmpR family regulator
LEVLIVEDDRALARNIARALEQAGYSCRRPRRECRALESVKAKAHSGR